MVLSQDKQSVNGPYLGVGHSISQQQCGGDMETVRIGGLDCPADKRLFLYVALERLGVLYNQRQHAHPAHVELIDKEAMRLVEELRKIGVRITPSSTTPLTPPGAV